ncbi:hypothetical protein FACS189499_07250 [Clostridia bacterium]|nr:hypothetical protein FACS189499_07250 [Clostridia bacterium]
MSGVTDLPDIMEAEETVEAEEIAGVSDTAEQEETARQQIFERDFERWRERVTRENAEREQAERAERAEHGGDYDNFASLPGTATAALSLIVMGALLFADFFTDNAGNALRFSPLMLMFLGAEAAVWLLRIRKKGEKIPDIGVTRLIVPAAVVAVSAVLMITAGRIAVKPDSEAKLSEAAELAEKRLDFPRISAGERVSADLENLFYPKLIRLGIIGSFHVRTEIYSGQIQPNPEYADFTVDYSAYTGRKDIRPGDRTYAHVKLKGISTTDRQFAGEARKAAAAIATESFRFDEILITTSQKGIYRAVKLDGKYELNLTTEEIERKLSYLIDGEAEDLETLPDVEDLMFD